MLFRYTNTETIHHENTCNTRNDKVSKSLGQKKKATRWTPEYRFKK